MKEKNKIFKMVLTIVVIILISLMSFGGIFVNDKNRMKNILPEYQLGMEFNGKRVFSIKPDETVNKEYYDKDGNKVESSSIEEGKESEYEKKEIFVNPKENLTKENFDKTKAIIGKRLELVGTKEAEIRENEENGEIYISIPENNYTDDIISQIIQTGDFKITDSTNPENVLIPGENVKEAKVGIGMQNGNQIVILNIQFDKEGTKKLKEISGIYTGELEEVHEGEVAETEKEPDEEDANTQNESNEENNTNDEKIETNESSNESSQNTKKEINLVLDNQTLLTTYFSEVVDNGILQLSMGNSNTASTNEDMQKYVKQASELAVLIQTEGLPLKYVEDTNLYMQSEYNKEVVKNFIIIAIVILAIAIIYAIIKYKKEGLLLMISQIGFIASLMLIIRYANVVLSITGILAIVLSSIMSYIFLIKILKTKQKEENAFHKVSLEYLTIYVPVLIISIVFSFAKYLPVSSFGMVMFYAIMLMLVYHGSITREFVTNSENK